MPYLITAFRMLLTYSLTVVLFACGGGSDDGRPTTSGSGASGEVMNGAGGAVEVSDPSSPIYGARVEIPPNSLAAKSETISLSYHDAPAYTDLNAQNDSGLVFSSKILVLSRSGKGPDGIFLQPVSVTIPYDRTKGDVAIPVLIDEQSGRYEPLEVVSDSEGRLTFPIAHFSQVAVVSGNSETLRTTTHQAGGFDPARNGFFIPNFTTRFLKQPKPIDYAVMDGVCFGMSAVAKWYYDNGIASPPLYNRYQERVTTAGFDDIISRDLAAFMQFNLGVYQDKEITLSDQAALATYPNSYYAKKLRGPQTVEQKRVAMNQFLGAMSLGRPQMLNLLGTGRHTLLVFRTSCNAAGCNLLAYDPDRPAQTLEMQIKQPDFHVTYSGVSPSVDYGQIFQLGSDSTFFKKSSFRQSFNAAELGRNSAYDILKLTPLPSNKLVEGTKNEHYVVFANITSPILEVRTDGPILASPPGSGPGMFAGNIEVYIDGVRRFSQELVQPVTALDLLKGESVIDLSSGEHQLSLVVLKSSTGQADNPVFMEFAGFYAARVKSYAGTYSGSFGGGDSGPVTVVIDEKGDMTGSGHGSEDAFRLKDGQVQADGSVDFGLTTSGARFRGKIDIEPTQWTLTGSWINVGDEQSGRFSLTKLD